MFKTARQFEDQAAAGDWLGEVFGGWADRLPAEEHGALADYKGEGYRSLNAALRPRAPLSAEQTRSVGLLDRALARFSLPEPVLVHRGFQLAGVALSGAVIQDPAYLSTSLLARHAEGFVNLPAGQASRPALARVLLPAGIRCGAPDLIEYLGEVEILLTRGQRLLIRDATAPTPKQPVWRLDLEALP